MKQDKSQPTRSEEIRRAAPRQWADHCVVRDRFVLDNDNFFRWLILHFNIGSAEECAARVSELDPIGERVVVDGKPYVIPDVCYLKLLEAIVNTGQ